MSISSLYTNALQDATLQSHERVSNYASDQIEHFENFIEFRMPFIVQEYGKLDVLCLDSKERHYINLTNVVTRKPMMDNSDPSVRALRAATLDILKPNEARDRGLTYSGTVYIDIDHTIFSTDEKGTPLFQKGPKTVYRELPIFEMPIMIRSKFCHAYTDSSRECWLDMGGYFIVRGNPKVLQPQKTQRINVHLVKGSIRGSVDADIRSLRADEKYRSTSTLYLHLSGSPSSITVDIPFLETGLPIIAVFRMLGFETQEEIDEVMWALDPNAETEEQRDQAETKRRVFSTNYSHSLAALPLSQVFDYAASGLKCLDPTPEKLRKQVMQQITGELLPHVGYDDLPLTRLKKAIYLSIIIKRMIDVHLGHEEKDDRDFEGYKSVQMSAGILSVMFRQQFAAAMKLLRNSIYKRSKTGNSLDLTVIMGGSDTLTRDILKAFSEGEVTVQKDASNSGTSVIQMAIQVNTLGIQTHIQRVSTPLPRAGKYKQLRGVDATQLFSFCPAETPEGEGCGLLQNLATFAHVRVGTDLKIVERSLAHLSDFFNAFRKKRGKEAVAEIFKPFRALADIEKKWQGTPTLIFVNSDPVGITLNEDDFIEAARTARRHGFLPFDCSIVRASHGVCISSDMGVVTFPLIHLDSVSLISEALECARGGREELWSAMKRLGIIEYVDSWEVLEYRVAFKPEEIDRAIENQEAFPFTHLAVHPSSFLGTCASSVPFSDHDQAPRVSYQSGMLKQAVSTPATNLGDRMDMGYAHTLWYPQRPMADTAIAHAKKINEWPMGENFIVAIAPFQGLSQEDSIIRNRASVDRGSGRISVFRMFKTVAKKRRSEIEVFEHPLFTGFGEQMLRPCEGVRGNVCYDKIGVDGMPEPGTPIKNNDVIVGKVSRTQEMQADGNVIEKRRDKSVIMCCEDSETFIVDRVMVSTTKEGLRTVRVRLRSMRVPQEGDKLSSRHGQKGTIGVLMNEEDMPFVMNGPNAGMRTDVIINLHSMNGRMTIGWLIEMVMSNLGVVKGNFIDATPFRKISAKWAVEELIKAGFGVEETMCNGMTGEVMEGKWFIGCSFYQMLKHMVLDKVTARQRGGRAALTRQPLDGRANKGGQRLGEMEKDALLSHGAAYVLDDRSRIASDAHSALVCKNCGHVGESRDETLRTLSFDSQNSNVECALCGSKHSSVTLPTTYCYSGLLLRELATVGIKVTHTFMPSLGTLPEESKSDQDEPMHSQKSASAREESRARDMDYEEDERDESNEQDGANEEEKTNEANKTKRKNEDQEDDFDEQELEQLLVEYEDLKVSTFATSATKGAKRMYSSISVSDE